MEKTQNLKEFTINQIVKIFKLYGKDILTLTPYYYKGNAYEFRFNFEAQDRGEKILNIVKIGDNLNPSKVVGFFRY